ASFAGQYLAPSRDALRRLQDITADPSERRFIESIDGSLRLEAALSASPVPIQRTRLLLVAMSEAGMIEPSRSKRSSDDRPPPQVPGPAGARAGRPGRGRLRPLHAARVERRRRRAGLLRRGRAPAGAPLPGGGAGLPPGRLAVARPGQLPGGPGLGPLPAGARRHRRHPGRPHRAAPGGADGAEQPLGAHLAGTLLRRDRLPRRRHLRVRGGPAPQPRPGRHRGGDPAPPRPDVIQAEWVWRNGKLIPFAEARTHAITFGLHYGLAVFEGIRCYQRADGRSALFRLREHVDRLLESAKIATIAVEHSAAELQAACAATVKA